MIYEIKHRFSGDVLFSLECGSLKLCVEAAVKGDANLRDADLRGANLRGANLWDAYLWGADLWGADLRGADLRGANLRGANLWDAYLWGADLLGADLRDANLWGADLRGADLWGADLRGADLRDADLRGADLRDANLRGAKWREGIIIIRSPLQIHGLFWPVTILDEHMEIGCELHTFAEWRKFTDREIAAMDGRDALKFWREHKDALLALCATRKLLRQRR